MDGNGRWAARRGLPRTAGHRQGAQALRRVAEATAEAGIPYLTVFALSVDNWQRPKQELAFLMRLLKRYLASNGRRLAKDGIRLDAIGELAMLPADVRGALKEALRVTRGGRRLTLTLGLSYSGRLEMIRAAERYATALKRAETREGDENVEGFRRFLWSHRLPPVDLLIRTGGEKRLSDFMLYDAAYAELYFTDVLWPDFGAAELREALSEYAARERRFGGVPVAVPEAAGERKPGSGGKEQ